MTFTYTLTTPIGQVRLELSDTTEPALFKDEEIQVKLDGRGQDVLLTAADLCDILATRFAQEFDFETDGQRFQRSQKSKAYMALGTQLRNRAVAGGGIAVSTLTRVDGYSSNLSTRDGARGDLPVCDFDAATDRC